MKIELRWVVPESTTTSPPVLQFRCKYEGAWGIDPWSEWENVPTVVVPDPPAAPHRYWPDLG